MWVSIRELIIPERPRPTLDEVSEKNPRQKNKKTRDYIISI